MKTKKSGQVKKSRTQVSHKRAVRRRPLHRRVLLHPISAFLLLCVGVLVAGSTFHGQAVSYDVTATVEAPALTLSAVITQPADQQHVTVEALDVRGTCPPNSYVKLFRVDTFAGVDVCNGGEFVIQTVLSPGANELLARVYNTTDVEGPSSSPITVYYDLPPVVQPPASLPVSLQISNVENNQYDPNAVREVTGNPTVSGTAPPFSDVVVTFYSEPSVCKTQADSRGVWSCTLPHTLPPGLHHVVIEATTPSGKKMTLPTFQVRVVEFSQPFVITSDYKYRAHKENQAVTWKLAMTGGTPPYNLTIDWGDGTTEQVARQDQSEFVISHTYKDVAPSETFAVLVTAVDSRGATTVLQLAVVVRGGVLVGTENNLFGGIVDTIRRWMWVVWPAYIAVVLMVISFWIGEREGYVQFMARRRQGRRPHARGR